MVPKEKEKKKRYDFSSYENPIFFFSFVKQHITRIYARALFKEVLPLRVTLRASKRYFFEHNIVYHL